jgi:acetyl esterase/lipase
MSVSPLTADLEGFPPTFVAWGGDEMFRDPIRRYVQRLRAAGCATEALEYEGRFHVFPILMPWLDDSRDVFRRMRAFIHKLLASAPKWSDPDIRRELGLPPLPD